MPTYDYKCNACGHAFEQFQGMKDKLLRTCPNCGKKALERLIGTGAAIVFKGSGFYQTDYRSESYKKAKEADGKPASGESSPTSGESKKSEAPPTSAKSSENPASPKPEAKPDAKPKKADKPAKPPRRNEK